MSSFHAEADQPAPQPKKKEASVAKKQQWSLWRFLTGNSMAEIARAKTPYKIAKEEEKTERIESRQSAGVSNAQTIKDALDNLGKNTNALVDDATDTAVDIVNSPNAPAIAGVIAGAAGGNPAGMLSSLQSMGAGAAPSSTSGTGTFHAEKAPKPKKDNNGLLLLGGGLLLLAVVSNNGSKK